MIKNLCWSLSRCFFLCGIFLGLTSLPGTLSFASTAQCQKQLQPKIENQLIHPKTGLSVYGKIQYWDLGSILSILHKRTYSKVNSPAEFGILIGFLIGEEVSVIGFDGRGRPLFDGAEAHMALEEWDYAAEFLAEQYPELQQIPPPTFLKEGEALDEEVDEWIKSQQKIFGRRLPVVQLDIWSYPILH